MCQLTQRFKVYYRAWSTFSGALYHVVFSYKWNKFRKGVSVPQPSALFSTCTKNPNIYLINKWLYKSYLTWFKITIIQHSRDLQAVIIFKYRTGLLQQPQPGCPVASLPVCGLPKNKPSNFLCQVVVSVVLSKSWVFWLLAETSFEKSCWQMMSPPRPQGCDPFLELASDTTLLFHVLQLTFLW